MPQPRIFGSQVRKRGRRGAAVLLLSGLSFALTTSSTALADTAFARQIARDSFSVYIAEAAQRFRIPAVWIRAVMRVESVDDPSAVSPKGAIGLMQIMPATWAELRFRHGLGDDPYDPRDNILAGAAYLSELHNRYGTPGFLAAYNAGPGRYEEHLATGRPLPAETRAYVTALSPFSSGGDTGQTLVTATELLPWTRAPLFVMQAGRAYSTDPVQTDERSGDAPPATPVRDVSAIVPQSGGLFVARTETGGPR